MDEQGGNREMKGNKIHGRKRLEKVDDKQNEQITPTKRTRLGRVRRTSKLNDDKVIQHTARKFDFLYYGLNHNFVK